jgi:hypothetical protein
VPRPTDTEPQETSMTTQTIDTTWRDHDDRDARTFEGLRDQRY